MWNIVIMVAMMSLAGLYAMTDIKSVSEVRDTNAAKLADSMAIYRTAVTQYFTANGSPPRSVDIQTLKAANVLPEWSPLYTQPATSIWANYTDAEGLIYIYAVSTPPPDVITHVLTLSHNSILVGVFRTGDTSLYSPIFGDTNIRLPAPSEVQIPNGSPVWVAMRDKGR